MKTAIPNAAALSRALAKPVQSALSRSSSWVAVLACTGIVTACGSPPATAGHGSDATRRVAAPPAAAARSKLATAMSKSAGAIVKPNSATPVKSADLISGVSCTARNCVAVGFHYYGKPRALKDQILIERWNGSAWQLESLPSRHRDGSIAAVSCPASTSCMAVGSPVLAWTGVTWRVTRRASNFVAVSCPAARSCVAVGQTGNDLAVYGRWNGLHWRTGRLHAPPHQAQSVTPAGISCTSASFCLAVGSYSYGQGAMPSSSYRDRILAQEWTGSTWRELPTHDVSRRDELAAVSCISATSCMAVGTSEQQFPVAEYWNGTSWRVERIPVVSRIGYTTLSAVSCSSAQACMAVGSYNGQQAIAEYWNGTSWRLQLPAIPPPAAINSAALYGVSCASRTACIAVGNYNALSYADRWTGTTWQLLAMPSPR